MLWPEKMYRFRIYFISNIKDDLISYLHRQGVYHLDYSPLPLKKNILDKNYDKLSKLSYALVDVPEGDKLLPLSEILAREKEILEKVNKIQQLKQTKKYLLEKLEELKERQADYKLLVDAGLKYKQIPTGYNVVAFLTSRSKKHNVEKILGKLNVIYEAKEIAKGILYIILSQHDISSRFTQVDFLYVPQENPADALAKVKNAIVALSHKLKEINDELDSLEADPFIKNIKYSLFVYLDRERAKAFFGRSELFYVLEGWLPESKLNELKEVEEKFSGKVEIEFEEEHQKAPTKLKNPKVAKPFEEINNMIGVPNYLDLDPAVLFLFTIPLLYGMIVGDVIYALFSFLFASWLERKFSNPTLKVACEAWKIGAIAAAFFGLLFNEWMGATVGYWLKSFGLQLDYTPLLHRVHGFEVLLLWTVIIGVVFICAGFILGFIVEWKHNNKKHAAGKLFWLLLLLLAVIGLTTEFSPLLVGMIILTIIGIYLTEGTVGIVEIPGVVGNVMSFMRIAAIGVAGVLIAEIINHYIPFGPSLMGVLFFPVLLFLHFANSLLAMFEGLIHGGRLNVLEFRSKFYKNRGFLYAPFKMKKGGEVYE